MEARPLFAQSRTGLTGVVHRSDWCSPANNTACYLPLSPSLNRSHNRLGPGHLHTRLKYTIGRVVLVLVSPLLYHSLLTLLHEAKLTLVTISPTIVTMKPHELRFRLGLGLFTWFLSTRLLYRLLLTRLLILFPKKHIPQVAAELDRLLEIICGVREYGWIWVFVKFVSQCVGLRNIGIFVVLLTVKSCIKLRLDSQAYKSTVLAKGPFFP
jgi:hypothetical protein